MFFLYLTIVVVSVFGKVPDKELKALKDFYESANGDQWKTKTNWNVGDPCDNSWSGIRCASGNTHVIQMNLAANNVGGTMNENLGDLTELEWIALDLGNTIGGPLPVSLGGLSKMTIFTIEGCKFSGPIPDSYDGMTSLKVLHAGYNNITHMPSLGNMGGGHMQSFVVGNNIHDEIPDKGPEAGQCVLGTGNVFKCPRGIPNWAKNCGVVCQ